MSGTKLFYVFDRKPFALNESVKRGGAQTEVFKVFNCPLKALYSGRGEFCHKVKVYGFIKSAGPLFNLNGTLANTEGEFEVNDFKPIEIVNSGLLMKRFASDLAIEASEPYKNLPGRGDGWTDEFIDYLETLDEDWRKKNQSQYSVGPNQLMRAMVNSHPAYALLDVLGIFYMLARVNNKNHLHVKPKFKNQIDALFEGTSLPRQAPELPA
jgi:hypothetical protein